MFVAVAVKHGTAGRHSAAQVATARALVAEVRAATAAGAILMEYDNRYLSHVVGFIENAAAALPTPTTSPTTTESQMPKRTPAEILAASGLSPEDQAEVAAMFGIPAGPSGHQGKSGPSGHQVKSAVAAADASAGVRLDAVQAAKSFNAAHRRLHR
jgi:hypothetical protein